MQSRIDALESSLDQARRRQKSTESELDETRDELEDQTCLCQKLKKQVRILETELEDLQEEKASNSNSNSNASSNIESNRNAKAEKEIARMQAKCEEQADQIEELEVKLMNAKKMQEAMMRNLELNADAECALSKKIAQLEARLAEKSK